MGLKNALGPAITAGVPGPYLLPVAGTILPEAPLILRDMPDEQDKDYKY